MSAVKVEVIITIYTAHVTLNRVSSELNEPCHVCLRLPLSSTCSKYAGAVFSN